MIIKIKKGEAPEKIKQKLSKLKGKKKKGIDAYKYCGTLKLNRDPMEIQKELRDEWN